MTYKSWYPLIFESNVRLALIAVALINVGNDCLFIIAPSNKGPKKPT